MDLAALIISAVAVLFSGAAFGWKVAEWLMSAGRARCYLMHGAQNDLMSISALVGRDGRPRTSEVEQLATVAEVVGADALGVEVHNVGRSPLIVKNFAVVIEGAKMTFGPAGNATGPALPHTIHPGDAESWWMPMHVVMAAAYAAYDGAPPPEVRAHMTITTPQRQVIRTKRSMTLTPGSSPQ